MKSSNIPFFVINLDSEIIRWNSVESEAEIIEIKPIRVPAINAKLLKQPNQDLVTPGVKAAWQSHLTAIRIFLESKSENGLIMEDDFHIENASKFLNLIKDPKLKEFDLIQIGFLKPGLDTRIKILFSNMEALVFRALGRICKYSKFAQLQFGNRMRVKAYSNIPKGFVIDDFQPGAHCYLISKRFACLILNLNEPQFLSIDDFYIALSKMRSFSIIRLRKSIVSQNSFPAWVGSRFLRE